MISNRPTSMLRDMATSRSEADLVARIFGGLFAQRDEGASVLGPWVGLSSAARFTNPPRIDAHPMREASYAYGKKRELRLKWPGYAEISDATGLHKGLLDTLGGSGFDVMLPLEDGDSRLLVLIEAKRESELGDVDYFGLSQVQRIYAHGLALKAYLGVEVLIRYVSKNPEKLCSKLTKELVKRRWHKDQNHQPLLDHTFELLTEAEAAQAVRSDSRCWRSLAKAIHAGGLHDLYIHVCRELEILPEGADAQPDADDALCALRCS